MVSRVFFFFCVISQDARRTMSGGGVVDRSTAKVALRLLERGMSPATAIEVCETSKSTLVRIKRHAQRNHGAIRDPQPGRGKQRDPRWHFGGPLGLGNSMLLDRVAASMDASSTREEIYDQYCHVCPLPAPAFSTTSTQLRRLNYTTKRLSSCNPDRNDARCAAWYAHVKALFSRRQLLCIDEVGCNKKAANRTRGISKRGRPAVTHLNVLAGGRKYSGLGVFSESGFEGMHVVDGAFNRESFLDAVDNSVVRSPCQPKRAALALDRAHLAHEPVPAPLRGSSST
jgi:hypothetical protein